MNLFNKVVKKLINKNISTSVVESCTGGLLSYKISSIPGVSRIYYGGLVMYSNKSKSSILKINPNKSKDDLLVLISAIQFMNHGWFETGIGSLLYQEETLQIFTSFFNSLSAFLQFCNGVSLFLPFKFEPIPIYINL